MSETVTMTLTEFLLARIAEDEQRARDGGADAMVGARWKHVPENVYQELQRSVLANARRVLAECEAKRRIVGLHDHGNEPRPGYFPTNVCPDEPREFDPTGTWIEDRPYCDTLRLLALPYAEHPEFREEWRP